MSADPPEDPRTAAIEHLEEFGLSMYAARTFVALTALGVGTARDVSDVAEVPRTRVYDAVDELQERGLVDVQSSSPKQFWPISADTAGRTFERDLQQRTQALTTALGEVGPVDAREEQNGVWTVTGEDTIAARVCEFIDEAEEEVVYMCVEDLLTPSVLDALATAAKRGVSIRLGGVSADVQSQIRDEVPAAEMFESLWIWSDTPAGRLMMVDEETTLVSALVSEDDADGRSETAIWGHGERNSLVVVLRAIFAWRLDAVND